MTKRERGIVRLDSKSGKSTHGWQARVNHKGTEFSRFFADKKHGGRHKARAKARKWRDRAVKIVEAYDSLNGKRD